MVVKIGSLEVVVHKKFISGLAKRCEAYTVLLDNIYIRFGTAIQINCGYFKEY